MANHAFDHEPVRVKAPDFLAVDDDADDAVLVVLDDLDAISSGGLGCGSVLLVGGGRAGCEQRQDKGKRQGAAALTGGAKYPPPSIYGIILESQSITSNILIV